MKRFIIVTALIAMLLPTSHCYALFGQKKARADAEKQAARAQADMKKMQEDTKLAIKDAERTAQKKAEFERREILGAAGLVIFALAGFGIYAATHREVVENKVVQNVVQQVVLHQNPARDIVENSVVIDGSNVVRKWDGNPDSLLRLLGVVTELEKRGFTYKCYFDATIFYVLKECGLDHQARAYRDLLRRHPGIFIEVPARVQADDAILDYAHCHGTPIISNDQYREYKQSYPWLENASKWRVPFVVHPTMVQLWRLGLQVQVPVSLNDALAKFEEVRKQQPMPARPESSAIG